MSSQRCFARESLGELSNFQVAASRSQQYPNNKSKVDFGHTEAVPYFTAGPKFYIKSFFKLFKTIIKIFIPESVMMVRKLKFF